MNSPLSQMLVESLGWTLVHFLWQGVAIAALLAVALRFLRPAKAQHRYLAGCAALLLLAAAPVLTFKLLFQPDHPTPSLAMNQPVFATGPYHPGPGPDLAIATIAATAAAIPPPIVLVTIKSAAPKPGLSLRLESLLPWVVVTWAAGVLTLSLRLLAGWLHLKRLQSRATTALDAAWHHRLAGLAARLGVARPVRLLQSALVEVPAVIGWLRPVILLPAGCLVGLSAAQLETILAHELAHIRRHDYLVNLLQSAVETVLFYHPAVWWVSRQVREERENCCDDLAVEVCGDRIAYARALATLEELRSVPAQLALAASGPPLLQRIRRLATPARQESNRSGWTLTLILALSLSAAVAVIFWGNGAVAQGKSGPGFGQSWPGAGNVPSIRPVVTAPLPGSSSGPTLTWESITGEQYAVQVTTNHLNWALLATVTATGPTVTFVDPTPLAAPSARFYRIMPMPHAATTPGATGTSEALTIASGGSNSAAAELQKAAIQFTQPGSSIGGSRPTIPLKFRFVEVGPMINLKARFVEVDHGTDLAQFGLGKLNIPDLERLYLANTQTFVMEPVVTGTNESGALVLNQSGNWTNAPGALAKPVSVNISGILNNAQLKEVIRPLDQTPGITTLFAPEVTTQTGQEVLMMAEDVQTGPSPSSLPIGPQLEVLPTLSEDGLSIQLGSPFR